VRKYFSICCFLFLALGFTTNVYAWKISAGTVTVNDPTVTAGFQTISFTGSFFDVAPVVFVLTKDTPSNEPRALRIQNVTTAGFEIIQVRSTVCGGCADAGAFTSHNVNWVAIEPGRHQLTGGGIIEVGRTPLTTTVQKKFGGAEGWDPITFVSAFSSASIAMVGQVQTNNNGVDINGGQTAPFITTAIRNATASDFETALELSEVVTALPVGAEIIGWLAAPTGLTATLTDTGSSSVLIEAILSTDSITQTCSVDINFTNTYSSNPLVVASKNRLDGGDGGWMRECQINTGAVRLRLQEDEGTDTDIAHTTESAGLFIVEKAFDADVVETFANWYVDGPTWTGAANEIIDSSVNNFNGTSFGGISPALGQVCNAADFSANSTTDYISLDNNALDGLTNLTLSFWVNTSNTGNQAALSAANGTVANEFLAWFPSNTSFQPFVKNAGLGPIAIPNIADSNWHHIVWTRSGANNCVSVDGVLSGCAGGGSVLPLSVSAGGLILGQEQDSVGGGFDLGQDWQGEIDEVIIFSRDLSAAEITALFNNQNAGNNWDGSARACPPPPPTILTNWYLDETAWTGAVDEVQDSGGNNNHGTALGGTSTVLGKICNAGDFSANATSDYISMNNNALDGLTNLTLSFWINTTNTNNQAVLSAANAGSGNEFLAWFPNNTTFQPFVKNAGLAGITIPDIADGVWHHVAWTRNGATNCVSVDGVQQGCRNGSTAALNVSVGGLIIGQEQDSVGGSFDVNQDWEGLIDEVIIFQRSFSISEVTTLYNNQNAGNNWDGTGRVCPGGPLTMEVAEITLNDTNVTPAFTSVTFKQSYSAIPLIYILPTNEGADPASIRIRNVSTSGFEVSQVEPNNLDGPHAAMTVHYMAIEPGAGLSPWFFTLPDGQAMEMGTHSTQAVQHGAGVAGTASWDTINFTSTFTAPAVLAGIQGLVNESANPPVTTSVPWMTVAMRNVGASSVELALERAEVASGSISSNETIAYLVIEGDVQGSFASGAATILYESITSADNITGWDNTNCATNVGQAVNFVNAYTSTPLVMANQSRRDGGDGGWVRRCSLTTSQIGLAIDEDQFANAERGHTTEAANLLVFSEAFCLPTACVGTAVDHYAISYLATPGVTCEAVAVRITAHDNLDVAVAPSSTTTITLSTTPSTDGWTLKSGNNPFIPPNQYTFDGTESVVEFWLTETTATTLPHIDIDVTDGTATDQDGVAEDDNIAFADTAFRFFADGTAEGIDPQISGKSSSIAPGSQTLQLRAVRTSTTTGACEAALTAANIPIDLGFTCNNPTTCKSPAGVTITAASTGTIAGNPNAGPITYSPINMNFGGTGVATFSMNYIDAGQITLHARKILTATGATTPPTTNFTLLGSSNVFVVKPAGLCVESGDTDADCASGDGTCSKFKKAGSANSENFFNLDVRGVTWETFGETNSDFCSGSNVTTPNFQLSSIGLTHTKVAPTGGTSQLGSLIVSSLDISAADNGVHTESNQAISEVGVFTVTAAPPSYLGETIAASTSENIGRFYPDRFNITMQNTPAFTDSCSGFTYQNQPFYYGIAPILEITAFNSNGIVTNNYGGSFWKLTISTLTRNYSDGLAIAPTATFFPTTPIVGGVTLAGDTDFDGIGTLALAAGSSADVFIYQKGTPEAEFTADVDVNFLASGFQDTDHELLNPVCYDVANDGTCDDFPHLTIQGTDLRWGRMILGNAFGSELLPVNIPLSVEYHDGNNFIPNTSDTCSTYIESDVTLLEVTAADSIVPSDTDASSPVLATSLIGGKFDPVNPLIIDAPGMGKTGSLDVTIDLSTQDWLQYDWDNDTNHDNDPTSRATWGIFSGTDEFIYIREPW